MNVVFVEPAFPHYQREFVRALQATGHRVVGIGERPLAALGGELQHWLTHYEQVRSVVDEAALLDTVRGLQRRLWIDRLEATVEAHILPVAKVREKCGIPGTTIRTAWLCRDKPSMKEALRAAGIPCAQSASVANAAEAFDFAARVGYPLVLKPRSGAGAAGTRRVDDDAALRAALPVYGLAPGAEPDPAASIAIEEFIEGHEGFLDTLCVDGEVRHEFISHYYPNVLEAMRERWISPQIVATNRIDAAGYAELRDMARRVIRALGIGSSATHMEWFFGPKGLKFSEIGCRPPGVGQWDVYAAANEFDIYREWALAVTGGRSEAAPSRRHAGGMIALRPSQDGRIVRYEGVERIVREHGDCIVAAHLPPAGTPTQPVEAGYMANAWLRLRHPDYDTLRGVLNQIGETVRVIAA